MRIGNSVLVRNAFPPEIQKEAVDIAITQMLNEFQHYSRFGKWYKLRIDYCRERDCDEYHRVNVIMDFDEIPEERVVIKSPEQICLAPTKSKWQKLKNCYRYLTRKWVVLPKED